MTRPTEVGNPHKSFKIQTEADTKAISDLLSQKYGSLTINSPPKTSLSLMPSQKDSMFGDDNLEPTFDNSSDYDINAFENDRSIIGSDSIDEDNNSNYGHAENVELAIPNQLDSSNNLSQNENSIMIPINYIYNDKFGVHQVPSTTSIAQFAVFMGCNQNKDTILFNHGRVHKFTNLLVSHDIVTIVSKDYSHLMVPIDLVYFPSQKRIHTLIPLHSELGCIFGVSRYHHQNLPLWELFQTSTESQLTKIEGATLATVISFPNFVLNIQIPDKNTNTTKSNLKLPSSSTIGAVVGNVFSYLSTSNASVINLYCNPNPLALPAPSISPTLPYFLPTYSIITSSLCLVILLQKILKSHFSKQSIDIVYCTVIYSNWGHKTFSCKAGDTLHSVLLEKINVDQNMKFVINRKIYDRNYQPKMWTW